MTDLQKLGKRKTILIFISILLISLYSIWFYHYGKGTIDFHKLPSQVIRFLLTAGLLAMVYDGKKWARIVVLILFSITIVVSVIILLTVNQNITIPTPFIVMIVVYGLSIYHLGFSKSFKAFSEYQKTKIQ